MAQPSTRTHTAQGGKMRPYIAPNGRQYFNYCLGAEFLCVETAAFNADVSEPKLKHFVFKVERCEYINGTEYYYMSRDGRAFTTPFTANRLHYLLHFSLVDELAAGTRQELPLTTEEVRVYYAARKAQFEEHQSEAYNILKNIPRYTALSKRQTQLYIQIGFAEAHGNDAAALEAALRRVDEDIQALCNAAGIDPKYLREQECCPLCGGTGLTATNAPCSCALKLEETIKDYCAVLRINKPAKAV